MKTKKNILCSKLKRTFGKRFVCKASKENLYTLSNKKKECLNLELSPDSLYVLQLKKCPDSSGSMIMKKLENVAKEMHLEHIDLADGQSLEFECGRKKGLSVLIKYINILADGESWYNKLGYKSNSHDAEVVHNKRIGQMNTADFVKSVMNFQKKSPYKRNDYWGPLNKTVKEYFTGIKEQLKLELPTKKFSDNKCIKCCSVNQIQKQN